MVNAFVHRPQQPGTPSRMRARGWPPRIPLGRHGRASRMSRARALYLASDEASFITGVAFPIDGGHLAGR